ncbi:efflux RND transporter permease subunit [Botrimarina mediterranea]|uniref:Cobalt-zinc-cadmium resistance protein CzcA n=1 Tax=Botrimarina mediterranea TaxID=2528022 RepID=A0A518K7D0_9BACT|nr:efflux RND transporter permease subunit [Botrimarina mediterranea]QDV73700.1 Cobalt-zinc-cadmium resistance protein CzcA [Botrimarina mediterranea]QDV78290.1 Cobalt-zinc-cadmium resistance protein CzcA [Planctomycetes bacterium K2D]
MLNAIIRFSLHNRALVAALAMFLVGYGAWQASRLTIDVFPNLNRPRVVVMAEAPGMAPEEVETLVTFPIETVLNGATGVQAVRTSSGIGLSVIYAEFDWGTDIYNDRQIVAERLALANDRLPPNVKPQLMPISSIMGQIMILGMTAEGDTSPLELRTLADWVVRQRLLTIEGVSQVIVMGGDRKQFQVLVNPDLMLRYGVTLHEVKRALQESNQNTAGGYLDEQGPNEFLVRSLGRVRTVEQIGGVVVKHRDNQSVTLSQVADVVEGPQVKRGDSAAFQRDEADQMTGGPAVVLTILKQPQADTRVVTDKVTEALAEMAPSLPSDVRVLPGLYQQKEFIDLAIENVFEALRDGGILVVVILFLFLMNLRTTLITLTAIPLSIAITAIVFAAFGLSVNTMTLGGLAVAIGELVDDAIVDVENIFRRLRENRTSPSPKNPLLVVFQASVEIRNSIVYGTLIVVLVFVPLFALTGMEGQLFRPMGVSYIVSLVSSLLVSLTVTPVLSYWLLRGGRDAAEEKDGLVLRGLKAVADVVIRASLRLSWLVLVLAVAAASVAGWAMFRLESDFLPPFNEGAVQINVLLPPGTSLATSNQVATKVEERLADFDDLKTFVRKTGRAELDEHAEGVNVTEVIATVRPDSERSREEVIEEVSEALAEIPGIVVSVEQPLAHLISHMLSGVKAQVAIKLYGDDLDELRRQAEGVRAAISGVDGVRDLQVEQQVIIPQLRIEADGERLKMFGLRRADVNEFVETAMQGEVVSEVLDGQRTFDLLVRLGEDSREDVEALRRLRIELPQGGTVKLEDVARIYKAAGPNTINREQVRRRIVVQCNVSGRGLVDVVGDIQRELRPIVAELPTGYFIEYGGQFQSQKSASRMIAVLFGVSLVAMFLVLYKLFHSANLALQVMVALPMAFIGSVASLYLTGQTLTIASMVGFISLCGIASRNGILLINHYLHLVKYEGESWSRDMVVRAGKDRLAPVLMTALTSGIGLIPLALSAGDPGKEILYPVATVIIGGLVTSTLLEFLVRPALFWSLGVRAAERVVQVGQRQVVLAVEEEEN